MIKRENIILEVLRRRFELPERIARVRIDEEMKRALEETWSEKFSQEIPYRFCYLAFVEEGVAKTAPVFRCKVLGDDEIFTLVPRKVAEAVEKEPKVALTTCIYRRFEIGERTLIYPIEVPEMKGWQFKGEAKPYRGELPFEPKGPFGEVPLSLKVREIYCAVTGRRLQ